MTRLALRSLALLVVLASPTAAEDQVLTAVSADVTHYRIGKRTVCDLAEPPACASMTAKRQRKLALKKPKKKVRRSAKLADGRTLEVRIAAPTTTDCAGITGTGGAQPDCQQLREQMALAAVMAPSIEVVVRDEAGTETQLVVDRPHDQVVRDGPPEHTPGTILHVVWSKDATRVVIEYQSSERVVVGWDLSSRLAAE